MIKTLWSKVGEYKKASLLSVFFTALEVAMELIIPLLMAAVIDKGIEAGDLTQVYVYGGIMLAAAAIGLCCGLAGGRMAARASSGFAYNLRNSMYTNIQTFSFSNLDKYNTSGLITRLTTDVTNVQNAYQMIIRMCVRGPMTLVIAMVTAMLICWKVSWIFCVAIVFLAAALAVILYKTLPIFQKVFKKYDDLNTSVQENVTGIRVVKSYVREGYEKEKFSRAADHLYQLFVKAEGNLACNNPAMMTSVYGCMIAISWFGAKMITTGALTTGELTSLFSYVMNILISLMMISMIFVMVSMSIASAQRIVEVINETTDIKNPDRPVMSVKDGSVAFEHVDFSYQKGKELVLSDITFRVDHGEMIGIIGGTGSSKTSMVNLISRLYDVNSGSVKVGGIDVRDYDLDVLRNEVAVVLQKNQLFSGTILENLRWADNEASRSECVEACAIAQADHFIRQLPDRYDFYIEQGGSNVSGGQKQRLCIARALLKYPKVLILDDSTSAVDTATDAKIRKAFREELSNITKFIISQRISSIQDADKIIVMKEGKINGFGTHEELLRTNEIYRSIYEEQTTGGGDFDE